MTTPEETESPPIAVDSGEAAWVKVPAPQPPAELAALCRDVEVLFRLNPYDTFSAWEAAGPDAFDVALNNTSNDRPLETRLEVTRESADAFTVAYSQGLKKRTHFQIEPFEDGSRLVVVDVYESSPETEQRLAEVDKSLPAWGESLRTYFRRQRRYGRLPGWRWYIRRLWIPMNPSARRVVWFIYLITVAEFFFFLFVLLIYVIEHNT